MATKTASGTKGKPKTPVMSKKKDRDCGPGGPGPNIYKLPPVLGYPGHDITRYRNPAFSVGHRVPKKPGWATPGPVYDPGNCTRFGVIHSPVAKFNKRVFQPKKDVGPGPNAYNLHNIPDPSKPSPPKITIKGKAITKIKTVGPGPNAYNPKDNAIYPNPHSATINPRPVDKSTSVGPAPNAYNPPYLGRNPPSAMITGRPKDLTKTTGPGPVYNPGYVGPRSPAFSIAGRPDPCVQPYIDKNADMYMDEHVPNPDRLDVC